MRLVEVTKVNIIIDEVLVNVPTVEVIMVKGGIKNCFFLLSVKGGGLGQSKKSLSENTQIFCDHFGLKTEFFYHFFHLGG